MWNVFGVLLGAVASMGTSILVEYLRRPSLQIKAIPAVETAYPPGSNPVANIRTVRVKIENKPLPGWAKWMLRVPALQCRAAITFHHLNDERDIFGRAMEGRWTATPEPIPIAIATNPQGQQSA